MPYSTAAKNLMLDALRGSNPTTPLTHASLLSANAGKAVTGATATDTFTATAHGYANGNVVVFSGLTGGTLLVTGDIYFVINQTANTFQVSRVLSGTAFHFTSDLSSGTVTRLVEVSGGSPAYARKPISFAAAADGLTDDTTNGAVFDVPAGTTVDYVAFNSAITVGTLLGIRQVTSEVFAGQGTYTLTDAKLDLNA